jgi:hypothetical protein
MKKKNKAHHLQATNTKTERTTNEAQGLDQRFMTINCPLLWHFLQHFMMINYPIL